MFPISLEIESDDFGDAEICSDISSEQIDTEAQEKISKWELEDLKNELQGVEDMRL